MKAMLLGFAAAIGIAVVAGAVLTTMNQPTAKQMSASQDVRL